MVVKWQGYQKHPKYQKVADLPGIGQIELMCRPNNTMLRITANDRRAETQMWMAKYETKNGTDRIAVKNVRIYTYATAADDGKGGTGPRAHEGLNQKTPIEDFAKGTAYGVISQRPGATGTVTARWSVPATSYKLTWYWERMAYPGSQYCKMKLALKTDTDRQFGLNWHGSDEAASRSTTSAAIPGLGDALLTCETGRNGERSTRRRWRTTQPRPGQRRLHGLRVQPGRGADDEPTTSRATTTSTSTRSPGCSGPVELPRNGMMRTVVGRRASRPKRGVLSSYMVTNNDARPWLNICEVAAARLP